MTPKANPLQASPIARTRIEEIRARLDNATAGPWKAREEMDSLTSFVHSQHPDREGERLFSAEFGTPADADFIAHAPDDIRDLLDLVASQGRRIAALEQENEALRDKLDWLADEPLPLPTGPQG